MICQRCRHFAASTPEGLCSVCADAPAPVGTVTPPQGHARLRSPVGLAKALAVLLGAVIAGDLFSLWVGRMQVVATAIVERDLNGFTQEDADRADSLYAASGVVQSGTLLATVVVFLVWFHRVRVNAEVFAPDRHSKSRGWAVWGWFVPVVNLWFPRRIALDIWDASGPDAFWDADRISGSRRSHALVDAWWTLWVVALFAVRAASTAYRKAEEADELQRAVEQMMLANSLDIAAAVFAILFVLRLTHMQNEKARRGPAPVAA